jgi:hypothetical protein
VSFKWHVHCPLLRLFRSVSPRKRPWAVCRNMLAFYSDNCQPVTQLPSWRTIPRLSVTVYSIYSKQPSQRRGWVSDRSLRKRRAIVTGTHINPGIFRAFTVMFWLLSDWASFWEVLSEREGNGQWRNELGREQCRETARILLYWSWRKYSINIRDNLLFAEKLGITNSGIRRNYFAHSEVLFRYTIFSVFMQCFVSNVYDCLC